MGAAYIIEDLVAEVPWARTHCSEYSTAVSIAISIDETVPSFTNELQPDEILQAVRATTGRATKHVQRFGEAARRGAWPRALPKGVTTKSQTKSSSRLMATMTGWARDGPARGTRRLAIGGDNDRRNCRNGNADVFNPQRFRLNQSDVLPVDVRENLCLSARAKPRILSTQAV